jgi:hypothetical protein
LFPALTSGQLSQIFTAWSYNLPWVTDYLVFDSSAATNSSVAQIIEGGFSNTNGTWINYGNAADAYAGAITGGFYDLLRPGPPNGRNGLVFTNAWTFSSTQTLIFAVPDQGLGDNGGGVSVLITPVSTPAPVPVLTIARGQGTVTLLWPTNAVGFNLEQTTNLAPTSWSLVNSLFVVVNTNNSVTLPDQSHQQFFRLHHP